jgi:hypothetical protein
MSLRSFQRAVADLTLSPMTARALRRGNFCALSTYELTQRERDRLIDIVRQPGISVHCSLSRGNRLEMIVGAFPMTCVLLRPVLRSLVDETWQIHRPTNYQLSGEDIAFAAVVSPKLAAGELAFEYAAEIFAYERACLELTRRARLGPDAEIEKLVEFQHCPDELLGPLSRRRPPPRGLSAGSFPARVALRGGRFRVELLAPNDSCGNLAPGK